jgi:hypothetical protein
MKTEDNRLKSNFIQEGGRCFHENKGRYINPYKQGSTQFNDFERGWSQALKRSPEQLLRDYGVAKKVPRRQSIVLPKLTPGRKKKEMSEDTYKRLANRAREKLLNNPSYQPPKYAWRTNVYYVRVEAYQMPLWKVGITSNNIRSRYCVADRRVIAEIKSWQYATREEAEAIEREILTAFAGDVYEGGPVLRSGGDSELFTRDVLKLDSQDDFLARARR